MRRINLARYLRKLSLTPSERAKLRHELAFLDHEQNKIMHRKSKIEVRLDATMNTAGY